MLKGMRIVISSQCQEDILNQLHEGHFRIDCTKLCVHDSVYWPQINKDIENLVKSCEQCQEASKRNCKDPQIPRELPVRLWNTLEADLFTFAGYSFLLVVDVMSRFPVLRILNSETTKLVLNALKGIHSDFGLPYKVISDNEPCFRLSEFKEFHGQLDILTETSSAYSISVGSVEHMVQTVKQIMTKNPGNTWLAMLIFRAIPIPDIYKSPA